MTLLLVLKITRFDAISTYWSSQTKDYEVGIWCNQYLLIESDQGLWSWYLMQSVPTDRVRPRTMKLVFDAISTYWSSQTKDYEVGIWCNQYLLIESDQGLWSWYLMQSVPTDRVRPRTMKLVFDAISTYWSSQTKDYEVGIWCNQYLLIESDQGLWSWYLMQSVPTDRVRPRTMKLVFDAISTYWSSQTKDYEVGIWCNQYLLIESDQGLWSWYLMQSVPTDRVGPRTMKLVFDAISTYWSSRTKDYEVGIWCNQYLLIESDQGLWSWYLMQSVPTDRVRPRTMKLVFDAISTYWSSQTKDYEVGIWCNQYLLIESDQGLWSWYLMQSVPTDRVRPRTMKLVFDAISTYWSSQTKDYEVGIWCNQYLLIESDQGLWSWYLMQSVPTDRVRPRTMKLVFDAISTYWSSQTKDYEVGIWCNQYLLIESDQGLWSWYLMLLH